MIPFAGMPISMKIKNNSNNLGENWQGMFISVEDVHYCGGFSLLWKISITVGDSQHCGECLAL